MNFDLKLRTRFFFILFFFLFLQRNGLCQISYDHFNTISQQDGLFFSEINRKIYQDSIGFTWISSTNGLYRFDGNKLVSLQDKGLDLSNNITGNICEDSESNIWFSTNEGLYKYNRRLDTVSCFQTFHRNQKLIEDYLLVGIIDKGDKIVYRAKNILFSSKISVLEEVEIIHSETQANYFLADEDNKSEIIYGTFSSSGNCIEKIINKVGNKESDSFMLDNEFLIEKVFLDEKSIAWFMDKHSIYTEGKNLTLEIVFSEPGKRFVDLVKLNDSNFAIATKSNGILNYNKKKMK